MIKYKLQTIITLLLIGVSNAHDKITFIHETVEIVLDKNDSEIVKDLIQREKTPLNKRERTRLDLTGTYFKLYKKDAVLESILVAKQGDGLFLYKLEEKEKKRLKKLVDKLKLVVKDIKNKKTKKPTTKP